MVVVAPEATWKLLWVKFPTKSNVCVVPLPASFNWPIPPTAVKLEKAREPASATHLTP